MANEYFTSDVLKLKRKCKVMRVAMYCTVAVWLLASIFGWSFLCSWLYRAGGATTVLEVILLVATFAVVAIVLFIALLICFPFHDKIEQYHEELRVKLNYV